MTLDLTSHYSNEQARRSVARELSRYYDELSDLNDASAPPFSVARLLLAAAQNQPLVGRERSICESAALVTAQQFNPNRLWIPIRALDTRALGTAPLAKGGALVGADVGAPADILRPWSVVAQAGVTIMSNLRDQLVIPRTTTATTASWIGENPASPPTETPPTLGAASLTPKTAISLIKFSAQLLRQGEAVEMYIRSALLAAVAELLDTAFLAGTGGAQPLGLTNTPGINAQSGASLAHAGIAAMRKSILNAGGQEANLAWIGTPTVQEVLGLRERATGGGQFLWHDGAILGRPAFATKNAPTAALVCGDFSQAVVGIFGPGIRIDVDPSQLFDSAGLVARVLLFTDCCFPQPGAFSIASSIS